MTRAITKGAILFAFGRLPGGPTLYRNLTRKLMGTQATHVDKLMRVWPGYIKVWKENGNIDLEGKQLWIHEAGYTIFPALAGYLITGKGPIITNTEGSLSNQYVERAVAAVLKLQIANSPALLERKKHLQDLAKNPRNALEWIEILQARYIEKANPQRIDITSNSVDLIHSGGVLEHYPADKLDSFLSETFRILTPSGISSHVVDHRDHLYHADKKIYFLNHLRYSNFTYNLLFGHHLTYHNRLSSAQMCSSFTHPGFDFISLRRHILPDATYCDSDEVAIKLGMQGLPENALHPQYSHSKADLHTAAAHYLHRKP